MFKGVVAAMWVLDRKPSTEWGQVVPAGLCPHSSDPMGNWDLILQMCQQHLKLQGSASVVPLTAGRDRLETSPGWTRLSWGCEAALG